MKPNLPNTPPPRTGGTPLITDFFKPIHHSEPTKKVKRGLEDEANGRPVKKRKSSRHAGINTTRFSVDVDTPKPRKTPASARLLDDSDGGFRDSGVGRWDFLDEETVEDEVEPRNTDIEHDAKTVDAEDKTRKRRSLAPSPQLPISRPKKTPTYTRLLDGTDAGLADRPVGRYSMQGMKEVVNKEVASPKDKHIRSSLSDRLRNISNNRNTPRPKKRPSSARLLDDTDAGLMDSVVGRFETSRYEEEIEEDKAANEDGNPKQNTSTHNTPTNKTPMGATSASYTEDNTNNRDRYTIPSPRAPPTTPEYHGRQSSSPSDQPSANDIPSSLLLPSPVMDLPAPSSPLSFDSSPIAGTSPPSTP